MSGTTALERAKNVNKELDGINRAHMKAESRKDSAEKTLHRSLVQLRETQGIDLVTLFEEEGVAAVARKAKSLLEDGRLELEAKVEKAERVVEAYSNSDYGQMRQILGVPEEVAPEVESNISASPVEVETEDSESEVEVEVEVEEPEVSEPEVSEPEVSEPEVSEPEVSEPEVSEPEVEADEDEADEPEAEESDSDEGIADSSVDDDDDPFGFDDDDGDDFTAQPKASDDEPASMTMADLDAKATSEDAAVTSTDDDDEDWGSLSFGDLLGNGPASL